MERNGEANPFVHCPAAAAFFWKTFSVRDIFFLNKLLLEKVQIANCFSEKGFVEERCICAPPPLQLVLGNLYKESFICAPPSLQLVLGSVYETNTNCNAFVRK